jgi:peptidoglycan/xylan/chitin deacetylase (PgdA/CDA1 family)
MEDKRRRNISVFAGIFSLNLLARFSGQDTIFPFYHVVSDEDLPHMKHLYDYRSESQFEADLETLLGHFTPISIEDYLEERNRKGKRRRMVLSFDDGLIECWRFIAPLLKKKGIPAIFFLNNDFIDNRGLFYRYKASLLVEHLAKDPDALGRTSEYMAVPAEMVSHAILMITYQQAPLLDALARQAGLDESSYVREHPVYMSASQIRELREWGFHLGAHGTDHPRFSDMEVRMIPEGIHRSMEDIRRRFRVSPACFAFPFTSDGVPEGMIDELLREGIADVIFGTAGLKKTGRPDFIQRIPMEFHRLPASRLLKTEFLYYLMKAPLGRNEYFKSRS